jgi:hypothetical protein
MTNSAVASSDTDDRRSQNHEQCCTISCYSTLPVDLSPLDARLIDHRAVLRPRNSQPVFGGLVDKLVRLGIRQPVDC